ncbi:amidohydrolase family protein [Desulfobacula sp.]|uniref:amidohydrolase family protein n=1 Tax=Desulfobacula sp. TaxID=2593537 RepID=UPI002611EE28|nr:amidohydrolase family protein [Desulfobacula sp.]
MIIDFHTHIFPRQKASIILSELSGRADIPHFTDGTLHGLLSSMETAGIHLSCISRITTRPEQVVSVNQWLHDRKRENILPLATLHPDQQGGEDYIQQLRDTGFKGIKVHPDYQGFNADDRRMFPFYEVLQSLQMPILFHAGLDRGLSPPFRAMPSRLLRVHREFPHLIMIAAHMGGEDNYDETEEYLLGTPIYLDTAFVLRMMDKHTLHHFFRKHPIDRFLFGSDSPFSDQSADLTYLWNLPFLTQNEKEKIAGKNAADLLGVGTTE